MGYGARALAVGVGIEYAPHDRRLDFDNAPQTALRLASIVELVNFLISVGKATGCAAGQGPACLPAYNLGREVF